MSDLNRRGVSLLAVKERKKLLIGLCILGLFLLPTIIVEAAPVDPTTEQELRNKNRLELQQREKQVNQEDVYLQQEKTDGGLKELPVEEKSFQIDRIVIEGDLVHRFSWTQRLVDQYAGQRIGQQGLDIILNELTEGAINRGMVTTRFQVGEQDISTGVLRIQLIPGKIGKIYFDEKGQKGSWATAFPTTPGRILDIRDLEQGLEQLKRVPSQDAKMDLKPGETPGETDVVITLKKGKAWRAGVTVDDGGSKSTGKYQGTASFSLDNVFQHNDTFSYSYVHDLDKHSYIKGSSNHSYSYTFPLGYWTFSFSAFPSKYHQTVEGIYSYKYSGESENYVVKAQRVIHRDTDSKSLIDLSIGRKFSKSFLDDIELESQKKDNTYLNFGISKRKNFSTGLVDVRLGAKRGVHWLGAAEDKIKMKDYPTNNFVIGTFDFNLMQQFQIKKMDLKYSFDFKGQATHDNLFGSEYFNIGGRYTVRGFDGESSLSAENGFYVRNELGIPVSKWGMEFYLGADYGQVTGKATKYLDGNKLAGGAFGVRGGSKGFYYDVFVGTPFYKPKEFESPKTVYGFQIGYQY